MAKPSGNQAGRTQAHPLTRASVIAAAVTLADEGGVEALSMRGLAKRLQVEAMSLYNHIADKEDLIDGMVDLVAGEIALPPRDGHWKQALRHRAVSAHEALTRHPWACSLLGLRLNIGPNMLANFEAELECLVTAGFSYPLSDHAMNAIDSHIRGFTLHQLKFPIQPEKYAQAAQEYLPLLPNETYPTFRALAELIISGAYDGLNDFSFGLDLILDGLDLALTRQPNADGESPVPT